MGGKPYIKGMRVTVGTILMQFNKGLTILKKSTEI